MPACSLEREVNGSTALIRISGKFDGPCAIRRACSRLACRGPAGARPKRVGLAMARPIWSGSISFVWSPSR